MAGLHLIDVRNEGTGESLMAFVDDTNEVLDALSQLGPGHTLSRLDQIAAWFEDRNLGNN